LAVIESADAVVAGVFDKRRIGSDENPMMIPINTLSTTIFIARPFEPLYCQRPSTRWRR
jgi:hypothetical protein